MASTNNRTARLASYQALADGLTRYASLVGALLLGGAPVKNAEIVARFLALLASGQAVAAARATYRGAVKADRDLRASNRKFVADVTQSLRLAFGGQPEILAAFGLPPVQRAAPTALTLAAAQAKAAATRKARGTKGSKQRAQIRGDVAGVVVTPLVEAAPQPAPSAGAPGDATPRAR